MNALTRLLKVLADRNRLRILLLLKQRKLCVCELSFILGVTQPSISRHLKKLNAIGLLGQEQAGFWTNYFLCVKNPVHRKMIQFVIAASKNSPEAKNDFKRLAQADRKTVCHAKGGTYESICKGK